MKKDEIKNELKVFDSIKFKYVVLGSSALVLHEIKDVANDIDIGVTEKDYDRFIRNNLIYKKIDFVVKKEKDIKIEFFNGYPLQDLEQMKSNKEKRGLSKDIRDIILIDNYKRRMENMGEYTDLYDENKNLTGEKIFRKKGKKSETPEGRYTIVVLAIIENDNNEILVQKTSVRKKGVWALPGGHVKSGQNSYEAIQEELLEEMDINVNIDEIKLFKTYKYENAFKDVFYIRKNYDLNKIKVEEDEVEKVAYLSKEDILKLVEEDKFRKTNLDTLNDFFEK